MIRWVYAGAAIFILAVTALNMIMDGWHWHLLIFILAAVGFLALAWRWHRIMGDLDREIAWQEHLKWLDQQDREWQEEAR